jgi:hypothetical protein
MCRDHEYGCHATATPGAVWTGTVTRLDVDPPTERPTTRTPDPKEGLEAWGIKLISVRRIQFLCRANTMTDCSSGGSRRNDHSGRHHNQE